ncbi:hypothetical protein RB10775 [Rhodopirellula baltica SH 1]|uniref:Uncharacterized protein n=1 Tax=Rhodopirellula baltica (strain DSM 10527 / NCIMB 13988 / SH1) TaxID=243090 RepID=Q7UK93_RHOBA|nr:hypothetical protein RB10775 [Rhodopirellula baltica SH 1]
MARCRCLEKRFGSDLSFALNVVPRSALLLDHTVRLKKGRSLFRCLARYSSVLLGFLEL